MEDFFIIAFSVVLTVFICVLVLLWLKVRRLEGEIVNLKYIKVEKLPDGGWKLTTRDGKPIFEL